MKYLRRVSDKSGEQGSDDVRMVAAASGDIRMVVGIGSISMVAGRGDVERIASTSNCYEENCVVIRTVVERIVSPSN
uniref:Uncharacterized protein n=1 Tax=Cucumis melo TaxID=3656 RepID=A0A9I9DXA0_CUCME